MKTLFEGYELTESQKNELLEAFKAQVELKTRQLEESKQHEIDIAVEAALRAFDDDVTSKTEKLLESLDDDVYSKTKALVEHVVKDKAEKLRKVRKFYENQLKKKAEADFNTIVEKIDSYLDVILTEEIKNIDSRIEEAAKNKYAAETLSKLQESLKITVMPEDVKQRVDESKKLKAKNKELLIENARQKGARYLESRVANLPANLQQYLRNAFGGRSETYIRENFDFLVKQHTHSETQKAKILGEKVKNNAKSQDIIVENKKSQAPQNPNQDPLISSFANALKTSRY
jgi:hypothetical protein